MKKPHELWHHEETLINHRTTWLLASQALIFAGFGWMNSNANELSEIARLFAWVGLATSSFILLGILAAVFAQIVLLKNKQHSVWLPTTIAGWVAAIGVSFTFVVAWIILLCKFVN